MMIIKAILLILAELVIYWMIGALASAAISGKKKMNMGIQVIAGFLCYQILFQICALPFIMIKASLTQLTACWNVVLLLAVAVGGFIGRKTLVQQGKELIAQVKAQPGYYAAGTVVVILLCYYVALNGRLDDDSVYYIGLVNTTLETDTMFRHNVYTGQLLPSLYLRRVLVTFEINSAVLAKNFQIDPIILMRVSRASLNIILSAFAIKGIGKLVYAKREPAECERKSITFMVIALYANFLMDKTIFTSATFLLHRAYEGKAYAAGTLILFVTYICLELILEKRKRNYLWMLIVLWASVAISTSALIVNLTAIGMWLGSYCLMKMMEKRQERVEEQNARS